MRRKAEHGFIKKLTQPANRMAQAWRQARWFHRVGVRKDVSAFAVVDAGMNMHATAGQLTKRFRHECGAITMFSGHTLHDAPEQERMSACYDRVGLMQRVDFPLPW